MFYLYYITKEYWVVIEWLNWQSFIWVEFYRLDGISFLFIFCDSVLMMMGDVVLENFLCHVAFFFSPWISIKWILFLPLSFSDIRPYLNMYCCFNAVTTRFLLCSLEQRGHLYGIQRGTDIWTFYLLILLLTR